MNSNEAVLLRATTRIDQVHHPSIIIINDQVGKGVLTRKMATQARPMLSNEMAPWKGFFSPALQLV